MVATGLGGHERALRRSGWLAAGVLTGLVLGFLLGLTRPRPKAA